MKLGRKNQPNVTDVQFVFVSLRSDDSTNTSGQNLHQQTQWLTDLNLKKN